MVEILFNNQPSNCHVKLLPQKIEPFWPTEDSNNNQGKCFVLRPIVEEAELDSKISFSAPFWYNSKHNTLLRLSNNVII